MVASRFRKQLWRPLCIASMAALLVAPVTIHSEITLQREIVPLDNPLQPQWKLHWDMGRDAVRKGNFKGGAKYYELVLREKPQIEEAGWEYCQLLVQLKRYQDAATILEGLIELNPNRTDYLVLAGEAALALGDYNRAVRHLDQAYSRQPQGKQGIIILQGLIYGLKGLDRKNDAFVLMEQLREKTPEDSVLILDLARMAHELGYDDKSKEYYTVIVEREDGNRETLDEAARLFTALGQDDKAAPLWKKLLQVDPENDEYHRQLLSHYRKTAESNEALPHVLALLKGEADNDPTLLLEAGRIYLNDQGRADKALSYYEQYLQLRESDTVAAAELATARRKIADELLTIVETNGAEPLWQDLSYFTRRRLEIFQLLAEKLETKKKTASLIQVLEIIYRQSGSNSDELALRLAELHRSAGHPEQAYSFYEAVNDKQYLTYRFYREKAEVAIGIGYDVAALDTLTKALNLRPDDHALRLACLELAGRLGFVDALQSFAQPLIVDEFEESYSSHYLVYLEGLRLSGSFAASDVVADRLLEQSWLSKPAREKLLLDRAADRNTMDQTFHAERLLRTLLVKSEGRDAAVFAALMENALLGEEIENARTVFTYYTAKSGNNGWKNGYSDTQHAFFLAYIHLLVAEGNITTAQAELQNYLAGYRKAIGSPKDVATERLIELEVELSRVFLVNGNKKACLDIVHNYEKNGGLPPELRLVKYIAAGNGRVNPEAMITNLAGRENRKGGVTELFRLSRAARMLGKDAAAIDFLKEIQRMFPQSMRARMELAGLLETHGRLDSAAKIYQELYQRDSKESWFYVQYLKIQSRLGDNQKILTEVSRQPSETLGFEVKLLQARALYATNRRNESFQLYESLLQPSVRNRFTQQMAAKGLYSKWQQQEEQPFWKMFGYEEPDWFDNLNRLEGQDGFLAHSETPTGAVAAQLYDSYRWERLIGSEFLARKALDENRYTVAEKQYRKNITQKQSTEGLKDLAKIYERLGEYGKQAEVYSDLEKRGEPTPELQKSIERNKIARAPTLGMNYEYLEKSGRGELINLQKQSIGVGFQYLPDLKSSLQLRYSELFFDQATGSGKNVDGRLFSVSGTYKFNERTAVELASGLQALDSDSDSSVTYSLRLNRKLDEFLSGYLEFNQELIEDTVDVLDMGLTTNSFIGGLVLEGTKGITIGGEYERLWYEDDNIRNRLFFFSSYSIFDALTTYEMKYSYEMFKNSDDDTALVVGESGPEVRPVLPYWSPDEYWRHMLSFRIHHILDAPEDTERPPSSYSFDISAGYESELDLTLGGGADIFLEIGSNFLVKGRLFYTESSDYKEESASISLMYRW